MDPERPLLDPSVRVCRSPDSAALLRTNATGWLLTNDEGVRIAEGLDGRTTVAQLTARLYGQPAPSGDLTTVATFIDELRCANLLCDETPVDRHSDSDGDGASNSASSLLDGLYVELTTSCDLRCRHCYVGPRLEAKSELGWPVVERLLADAVALGATSVAWSGGDVLLYPHWRKALELSAALGLRCTFLTNGLRVDDTVAAVLRATGARPQISLDGAEQDHDSLRGRGTFSAARAAIRRMLQAGVTPSVATTVWTGNAARTEDLLEFCFAEGLRRVALRFLQPIGNGEGAGLALDQSEQRHWLARLGPQVRGWQDRGLELVLPTLLDTQTDHGYLAARPMCRRGDAGPNCPMGRSIAISADGLVHPCSVFLSTTVSVGNVLEESLRSILESGRMAATLRAAVEGFWQVCGDCPLACLCQGGCRAVAWAAARRWDAKDPLCPLYEGSHYAMLFGNCEACRGPAVALGDRGPGAVVAAAAGAVDQDRGPGD